MTQENLIKSGTPLTVKRTAAGTAFEPVVVKRGVYPAVYKDVRPIEFPDKKTGEQVLKFAHSFEITAEGPEKGKVVDKLTSRLFNEKTKLFELVSVLSPGKIPEVDGELDLTQLIGTRCAVMVDSYKKLDGKEQSYVKEVFEA